MKLHEITGLSETVFNIEVACAGMHLPTIGEAVTMKVERVNKKTGTSLIIPEMEVIKLDAFFNTLFPRTEITNYNAATGIYSNIFIPIALGGVIELHEDDYLKVTLKALTPDSTLVVNNIDALTVGAPISLLRQDIKSTLAEKAEDLTETAYIFFDSGAQLFSKIEVQTSTARGELRTVQISDEQILQFNRENRISLYDSDSASYIQDNTFKAYPVMGLNKCVLHKEGTKELVYYKVKL